MPVPTTNAVWPYTGPQIPEDGVFIAECPSIPGCLSQTKAEEEAEENIRDAIKECLEVRAENGLPLTVTTREVEVVT